LEEIFLVRHGSVHNPEGLKYWRLPGFPLSERGVEEAGETARFLQGRSIERIYHSPLERCVQTAAVVARVVGAPLVQSDEISEWDEGESLRDVQARMNRFWTMLRAEPGGTAAVVSHRDPLRVLMLSLAGRRLAEVYDLAVLPLEPGEVWLLRPGPGMTHFENVFAPGTGRR
jgi:broad specificity phosphatase PhoE